MTWLVDLRGGSYGAVCSPFLIEGDTVAPAMHIMSSDVLPIVAKGKNVLVATHGFNVSYEDGLQSLGNLAAAFDLRPDEFFLGVLWPGDFVIPAVNYPFEDKIASHCGALLGAYCNRHLKTARSLSFLSHSLGARVILEAIDACTLPVRSACIAAGAVNADCLGAEYAAAVQKCAQIRTLSSRADLVLRFAYPAGDAVADILDPDHQPFEPALGRGGPLPLLQQGVLATEIPTADGYDHGDYLPPATLAPGGKWRDAARFMASAFRGGASPWP